MDLYNELIAVLDAFDAATIDYALCGGVAVALHGYSRFTKDIDVLIRQDDLDRARHALWLCGYSLDAGILAFAEGSPTERRVYRVSRAENAEILTVDLVLVTPILDEVWMDRDVFDWNGRQVRVVSARGLAIMKRLAGRPQDLVDLDQLGLGDDAKNDDQEPRR